MSSKDRHINFKLMRDRVLNQRSGKEFWRSMEEYADSDELQEFVSREFPQHAETWDDPVERRTFLKLMGASLALAGLSGCVYQPPESVVPYVTQPEQIVPGKPNYYATAMVMNGIAQALLARSNEGRPTKLEGNPDHPASSGATDKFAQASLLTMYDPDRSQNVLHRGEVSSWDAFLNSSQTGREGIKVELSEQKKKQGAGLRILTESITSPTQAFQIQEILKEYPQAKWYSYDPIGNSNAHRGALMAFGSNVNVVYKFGEADRILSLDADFLADMPGNLRYIWDFSERREPGERMNRLYTVESVVTLTGAKSDHRLSLRPSEIENFARAVAKELGVAVQANALDEKKDKWAKAVAKDLQAHKGTSIVIAGESQPPIVHAIAHAINNTLGNVGKTVVVTDPIAASQDQNKTQLDGLKELVGDMNAGKVECIAVIGGNPVYDAPADLKFLDAFTKVRFRVHLSLYNDETSEFCHWHINQAHFLEMWGDARAHDGTVTLIQPLIEPLYGGKSPIEFLNSFAPEQKKGYDLLRAYWATQKIPTSKEQTALLAGKKEGETAREGEGERKPETSATPNPSASPTPSSSPRPAASPTASPSASPVTASTPANTTSTTPAGTLDETSWKRIVHDGFIAGTALPAKTVALKTDWVSQAPAQVATGYEVVFRPDPNVYDGSFANNGWLQELPKPLTSMTWDNAVLMNPATAKKLALTKEDGYKGGTNIVGTVNIESQGNSIKNAPIWLLPGMPDDVVLAPLGYGRTRAGNVGNNIGFDSYKIRSSSAPWFGSANIQNAGGSYDIASTQLHFYMENRDLVRTVDLESYKKHPEGEGDRKEDKSKEFKKDSMYDDQYDYDKEYRWGMSIDLNKCTGCNACVIACQSENNIPVVGKEQVSRSREMHWLRVDTYFGNKPDEPEGPWFMPVPCQQCEQAPCEPVCPVHATSHSADGLNDMTYNRCVGTRYCSNNCPYKVRRFNFLLYQDWNTPQYHLMRNPEVSVRSRGVMEKCTYCVQRIQNAKIESEKEDRKVLDGEVVTACQAVCPADAIAFGDMNDASSRIAKLKKEERNYTILADLNTQPRTSYLTSIKNPNPELKEKKTETHGAGEGH